jgi:NADH-quinone oxidoreductase subunit F
MICDKNGDIFFTFNEEDVKKGLTCVVDFAMNLMDLARKESCGKCVFCREGTTQVYEIIKDITKGMSKSDDFELLSELLDVMKENAGCEMTKKASLDCLNLMENYKEEWVNHIRRKKCTNLICKSSFTLYVDPLLCDGCTLCKNECPNLAILGDNNLIHIIDTDKCVKCMNCINICPKSAIKKAGLIKPKLPKEPIAVGSFKSDSENSSKKHRRRRKN